VSPKRAEVHSTFSGMTFAVVVLVALLVIALALFATPLLAVIILGAATVFLVVGMSALRQRSAYQDETPEERRTHDQPIPEAAGPVPPPQARVRSDPASATGSAQPRPDQQDEPD
jgi:hypothetical protein